LPLLRSLSNVALSFSEIPCNDENENR
jgi:hypothetical protein